MRIAKKVSTARALTEERAASKAVSNRTRESADHQVRSAVKACMVRGEPICSEA